MQSYFQHFSKSIKGIELPKKFTFPFYYEPHLLCKIAVKELQKYLKTQTDFEHNFGLTKTKKEFPIGKMFGVLIVQNQQKEVGYIAAVSGKLAETNTHKKFVPPVFDMLTKNSFFLEKEEDLNRINQKINELENNAEYLTLLSDFQKEKKLAEQDFLEKKEQNRKAKNQRNQKRNRTKETLSKKDFLALENSLGKESLEAKQFLNNVQRYWQHRLNNITSKIEIFKSKLEQLKEERKNKSATLQKQLFENYQFLNQFGEIKDLLAIFSENPPAGAGECAAPKLLQYAFKNNLKPLAMAEFWWGQSPNTEVRKHNYFYPACQGKCKPILSHMLKGMELDTNPMLQNPAIGKELEILFEDEDLAVINKPEEFLSVPGIHIQDSVYTRLKHKYPSATGPLIVHRLDMSTSGILLIAKNKKTHKALQSQFVNKTIQKRYVALVDKIITKDKGKINLPLRVDLDDRPRQMVCFDHGKSAETLWEVVERNNNETRIYLYPITGRTHQLRVHCSHKLGLNAAIIGDDLYGKKVNRLHLHADKIVFIHPSTKKKMSFYKEADF